MNSIYLYFYFFNFQTPQESTKTEEDQVAASKKPKISTSNYVDDEDIQEALSKSRVRSLKQRAFLPSVEQIARDGE